MHPLADDDSGELVSTGIWYRNGPDEYREWQRATERCRFAPGVGMIGRVLETRQALWLDDVNHFEDWRRDISTHLGLKAAVAFPVLVDTQVVAVLEFFSARPMRREVGLAELMSSIGIQLGHLIRRKRLEKVIADRTDAEQRSLGQELHDTLGQQLTAVAMLTSNHRQQLEAEGSGQLEAVDRLVRAIDDARQQAHALTKGLLPVEVDAEGLRAALDGLVQQTRSMYPVDCQFECQAAVRLDNNFMAMQLYRIVQEAVHNAVKHARARCITVGLRDGEDVQVQVRDDGVGFDTQTISDGNGLRIMHYRADLIGARLAVESQPSTGTVVTCICPQPEVDCDTGT